MYSKKATKIDEIFTVDLTLCSKCQIDSEDFVDFVAFLENTNFIYNFGRYMHKNTALWVIVCHLVMDSTVV